MSGKQQLVGAAGFGLLAASTWTNTKQRSALTGLVKGGANSQTAAAAHTEFKQLGAEALFLLIAVLLAGVSDSVANGILAIIAALFLLWAITHFAGTTPAPATKGVN